MSLLEKADPEKMREAIKALAERLIERDGFGPKTHLRWPPRIATDAAAPMVPSECEKHSFPYYKSIAEHPGFTAKGAHDAFVQQYTQNQLDAAIAAERERCAQICEQYGGGIDSIIDRYQRGKCTGAFDCAAAIRNQEKKE